MLNILTFAFYKDPQGAIGGGWYRTIELLKRGKKYGINYIVIEPAHSFKKTYKLDYSSHPINIKVTDSVQVHLKIFYLFLKEAKHLLKKEDVDLIYSPVEAIPTSLFPKIASINKKTPWTIMLHLLPLYGTYELAQKYIRKKTIHLKKLFDYLLIERSFDIFNACYHATLWELLYFMLKNAKTLLTVSRSVKEDLYRYSKKLGEKTLVVFPGNGIDYKTLNEIPDFNKEYDAVVVASWHPKKGLWDTLRLWKEVVRRKPNAKLAITGKLGIINETITKNIINRLKTTIKKLGITKNVTILNDLSIGCKNRKELWKNMKKAKIMIYLSQIDAWPLMVGEAFALGLPVIAYDIPSIKYSYGTSKALIKIRPETTKEKKTVETIINLIENENELNSLASAAKKYIQKYYSWDEVMTAEKRAYEKVINLHTYNQ